MKSWSSSLLRTLPFFGLILANFLYYLVNPSSYYIPVIFAILFCIIFMVFGFREYYNKNLYLAVGTILITLMWLVSYLTTSADVNRLYYSIEIGVITLLLIAVLIDSLKKVKKRKTSE